MDKLFNLVLSKFTFSGDIINGYWMKRMAIKGVTNLNELLFRPKKKQNKTKQRRRDSIWTLFSLSVIYYPPKIDPYDLLALVFFRYSIDNLIFGAREEIHFIVVFFFKLNALKLLLKLWYDALHLSGYHIIKTHVSCRNWYLSSTQF